MSVVCVVGGGPAGSTVATRLAALGHEVWLVEKTVFPRRQVGEALTPGVLPLLETIGARAAIEAAGFTRLSRVAVDWEDGPRLRDLGRESGLAVTRGRFDRLLLDHAARCGVRVLQPATLRSRALTGDGWTVEIDAPCGSLRLAVDLVIEATGRSGGSATRDRTAAATIAFYAWWPGTRGAPPPVIEARAEGWFWGLPLPDGTYNTLAFVDARRTDDGHGRGQNLRERFLDLLARSTLPRHCSGTPDRVAAVDATPYLDRATAAPRLLKVGDCALALDPLSSSGVQKAIQSALAGAIVANTLLRRPDRSAAALQFHRTSLEETAQRHGRWAAAHYARVGSLQQKPFWRRRAVADSLSVGFVVDPAPDAATLARLPVGLSPKARLVDTPCLDGDFVAVKQALCHPALEAPLAYLGGHEVAPLVRDIRPGLTIAQLARGWAAGLPFEKGLAMAHWMLSRGVLVAQGGRA